MSAPPIACMLTGQDLEQRVAWIADLNRRSLQKTARADLQLTLTYDRSALKKVEQMVEQERACCPFLTFDIQSDRHRVNVRIVAPEDAREVADEVFKQFTGNATSSGCSCCGTAA